MHRRRAFFVIAVLVAAGCASVLGAEDGKIEPDGGSLEGGSTQDGAGDGGGPINVCAEAGDLVYAFEAPGDCWRYGTDPQSIPSGFSDAAPAFRLVADSVTFNPDKKQRLYLLRSRVSNTEDYLVSPISDEDPTNYQLVGALSSAYYDTAERPPGTIEVRRWMRTTPKLRHKLFVEGDGNDASAEWTDDKKRYFLCPLK